MSFIAYYFIIVVLGFLIVRVSFLIYKILKSDCGLVSGNTSLKTIYCIGSGGHTTELLRITSYLDVNKYQPRLYIMAKNDTNSERKILNIENRANDYTICRIPRSRNVKQSFISSVFSSIYSTYCTIPIIYNFKPDVIFCNGPGICVPVVLVAFLFRCIFILDCRVVFIESLCRVRTLSLTGKILQFLADVFVIQWPQLRRACYRGKYFGRLT